MASPYELAALLGALRGLTEFLPVSSSGHFALAETLFGVGGDERSLRTLVSLGTLAASGVFLRKQLARYGRDLATAVRRRRPLRDAPARAQEVLLVLIASVPTAILGLLFEDSAAAWAQEPLAVGFGFLLTGALLISSLWAGPVKSAPLSTTLALLIGVAQGLSVFPGISRSAATLVAALWLGMRAERAFEFSILVSIPAVAGSIVLRLAEDGGMRAGFFPTLLGATCAFALGLASLYAMERVVSRGQLAWFALWVLPLALATLALARAWPGAG